MLNNKYRSIQTKKRIILSLLLWGTIICNFYGQNILPGPNTSMVLIFEEEFNGTQLNTNFWKPKTGVSRDVYFDSQKAWHTPENIIVESGLLKIVSKHEIWEHMEVVTDWGPPKLVKYDTFRFSTGEIVSKNKYFHGVYSARVKLPKGKGFWPAFWLYSGNPWNEIDVFEFWNENDFWAYYDGSKLQKVHHMNMWNEVNGTVESYPVPHEYGTNFSDGFHTFTMIWQKDLVQWYVDGTLVRDVQSTSGHPIPSLPVNPMKVILNVAIQHGMDTDCKVPYGWHNEAPADNASYFPAQMEVEWVKHHALAPFYDNLTVTNQSQVYLPTNEASYLTGNSITFNCDFQLASNHSLKVIANDNIILKPGFKTSPGASHSFKIGSVSSTSSSALKSATDGFQAANYERQELKATPELPQSNTVCIYPNPSYDDLKIDFGANDFSSCSITICNINGQVLYSLVDINSQIITINRDELSKGIYFLQIKGLNTTETIRKKIVLL